MEIWKIVHYDNKILKSTEKREILLQSDAEAL